MFANWRNLMFSTASRLWPFILNSFWKPFVLSSVSFVRTYLHFVHCDGCIKTVNQHVSFIIFCIYKPFHMEAGNKPFSDADTTFNVSQYFTHDSLQANVKEDDWKKTPLSDSAVVLNQSDVLPLKWTTLWALSYRFQWHIMLAVS